MHTIKPIDADMVISSAKETGALVTAEEHQMAGGLGSAVAEVLGQHYPRHFRKLSGSKILLEKAARRINYWRIMVFWKAM